LEKEAVTKTVDVREAQAQLPELLTLALEGNEVIISEGDKPLARLVPVKTSKQKRIAGLNRGSIWTSDDFDEPLPDEFWAGTE
jgi:antitoxin (DNA-binding transcriptional repressor) of toxin-antitoxin stability system